MDQGWIGDGSLRACSPLPTWAQTDGQLCLIIGRAFANQRGPSRQPGSHWLSGSSFVLGSGARGQSPSPAARGRHGRGWARARGRAAPWRPHRDRAEHTEGAEGHRWTLGGQRDTEEDRGTWGDNICGTGKGMDRRTWAQQNGRTDGQVEGQRAACWEGRTDGQEQGWMETREVGKWMEGWLDRRMDRERDRRTGRRAHGAMDRWMHGGMDSWTDRLMQGGRDGEPGKCRAGWTDRWTDGCREEWTAGWTDG